MRLRGLPTQEPPHHTSQPHFTRPFFGTSQSALVTPATPPVEVWQRACVAAIEEAMGRPGEHRLLVVSHGGPHGWWLSHLLGMPLSHQRRLYLAKCHDTLVRWTTTPSVHAINLSLHEPWGLP